MENGKCDPYCICRINQKERFRTRTATDTVSPVWRQEFRIPDFGEFDSLEFLIADDSFGTAKHRLLGQATLPFSDYLPDGFAGELDLIQVKKRRRTTVHKKDEANPNEAGTGSANGLLGVRETMRAVKHRGTQAIHLAELTG